MARSRSIRAGGAERRCGSRAGGAAGIGRAAAGGVASTQKADGRSRRRAAFGPRPRAGHRASPAVRTSPNEGREVIVRVPTGVLNQTSLLQALAKGESGGDALVAAHLGVKGPNTANEGGSVGVTGICHVDILIQARRLRN